MNDKLLPKNISAAIGSGALKISQPDPPDVDKPPC
jgi:hypothetical protein